MVVKARVFVHDGYVSLDLRPDEAIERVEESPDLTDWRTQVLLEWDAAKLDRGEWELVSAVVPDIARLERADLAALGRLALPRVSDPAVGLEDVTIQDALRWAQRHSQGTPRRADTRRQGAA